MITASVQPICKRDLAETSPLYHELEIHMQRLGHLIPYREQLNWTSLIQSETLGDKEQLKGLQKLAAKNNGSFLFYLKWTKKTIYQHLLLHPNTQGLYLPFRFDDPFTVTTNHQKIWIGSIPRLRDELKWLELAINHSATDDVTHYWKRLVDICECALDQTSAFYLKTESA